jgi:hypothetical protein
MQVSKEKAESPCPLMHSCANRHTHWYSYKLDVQASTGRATVQRLLQGHQPIRVQEAKVMAAHVRTSSIPRNYLKTSRSSADKHSVRWAGASHTPRLPLFLYSSCKRCQQQNLEITATPQSPAPNCRQKTHQKSNMQAQLPLHDSNKLLAQASRCPNQRAPLCFCTKAALRTVFKMLPQAVSTAYHHHHHVTQSSHSINAIGPAPRARKHSLCWITHSWLPQQRLHRSLALQ